MRKKKLATVTLNIKTFQIMFITLYYCNRNNAKAHKWINKLSENKCVSLICKINFFY